jgi:predicted metal-dependent enzyme (double-stranded beta helix superfamily)
MLTDCPKFDRFVADMRAIMAAYGSDESGLIAAGRARLAELVAVDDWLPDEFARPASAGFKQYILFRQSGVDFSVISVVWARGQKAIAHDHTMWGMFGQLRGAEATRLYDAPVAGQEMTVKAAATLRPGDTAFVSPSTCDIHDVENVNEGVSVSIHVYGGDLEAVLDRRHRYDTSNGQAIPFITQYH